MAAAPCVMPGTRQPLHYHLAGTSVQAAVPWQVLPQQAGLTVHCVCCSMSGLKSKTSGAAGAVAGGVVHTVNALNPMSGRRGQGFQRYKDEPLAGQLQIPVRDP